MLLAAFLVHGLLWAVACILVVRLHIFPLPLLAVLLSLAAVLAFTTAIWGGVHATLPAPRRRRRWLPVLFVLVVPPGAGGSFLAMEIGLARTAGESGGPLIESGEWVWYSPGVDGMRLLPGTPLLHACPDGTAAFGRIFAVPGQSVRLAGRSVCVDDECFPQRPLEGDRAAAVEVTRDRFHVVVGPAVKAPEVQIVEEVPPGWFVVLPDLRTGAIQSGCGPQRPMVPIDEFLGTPRHVVWAGSFSRIGSPIR